MRGRAGENQPTEVNRSGKRRPYRSFFILPSRNEAPIKDTQSRAGVKTRVSSSLPVTQISSLWLNILKFINSNILLYHINPSLEACAAGSIRILTCGGAGSSPHGIAAGVRINADLCSSLTAGEKGERGWANQSCAIYSTKRS
jgi:hypothetical protein